MGSISTGEALANLSSRGVRLISDCTTGDSLLRYPWSFSLVVVSIERSHLPSTSAIAVTVVRDAIGAPDYEQWPVTAGIRLFLSNWEKGGIELELPKDAMVKA